MAFMRPFGVAGTMVWRLATTLSAEIGGFPWRCALKESRAVRAKGTVVAQLKSTDLERAFDPVQAECAKATARLSLTWCSVGCR